MINRKKLKLVIKFLILALILLLLAKLISFTLSKYESLARTNTDVDVALYLFNTDFQTMTLNLDSLFPSDELHVYTFSIGNTDGKDTAQTDLEYNLKIRTTTNLAIEYELYMNQNYTDSDATSIIKTNTIEQDEDGTYFRIITTDTITLKYTDVTTNIYQLVLYFPAIYNTIDYQDIIEAIEINVDSKQIIDSN